MARHVFSLAILLGTAWFGFWVITRGNPQRDPQMRAKTQRSPRHLMYGSRTLQGSGNSHGKEVRRPSSPKSKGRVHASSAGDPERIIIKQAPYVSHLSLSPDGKVLVYGAWTPRSGTRNDEVRTIVYHRVKKTESLPFKDLESGDVSEVTFSPDSRLLAVSRRGRSLTLWTVVDTKEIFEFEDGKWAAAPAFSPDGKILGAIDCEKTMGNLLLWDVTRGKKLHALGGKHGPVSAFSFSEDGRTVITEHCENLGRKNQPPTLRLGVHLWDALNGRDLGKVGSETIRNATSISGGTKLSQIAAERPGWYASRSPSGVVVIIPSHRCMPDVSCSASEVRISLHCWSSERELFCTADADACFDTAVLSSDCATLVAVLTSRSKHRYGTTLLVWDLQHLARRKALLPLQDFGMLWKELGEDAQTARQAMCSLAMFPLPTLAMLQKHLRPIPNLRPAQITRLLAQLDSRKFQTRELAEHELQRLGEQVLPCAREVLGTTPSLEVRRRIIRIVDTLEGRSPPPSATLQGIRGVSLLKQFGDYKSAREILKLLAQGAPGTWLTREATAALASVSKQPAPLHPEDNHEPFGNCGLIP